MQGTSITFKRMVQVLILIILGAAALMVVFINARLFINPTNDLPPTIDPLVPSLDLSITVTEDRYALVSGTTNLPDTTMLTVSVDEEKGNFLGQEQATVENGHFQTVQIGPAGGLEFGPYTIKVLTLPSSEQPSAIQERFGPNGINLVGDHVIQESEGAVVSAEARFVVVRPAPVLRSFSGGGIGLTAADHAVGFELTLQSAHRTNSAFGVEPTAPANQDYGKEFIFIEFTYKNIGDKGNFVSYVDFVLFVNESFALTDINVPFTYYPDGRFTVMEEAKEYGFFSIQEVLPGESLTGKIAYMVPEIARKFVFSSNATSCIEQDGTLQCFSEHPNFEFND